VGDRPRLLPAEPAWSEAAAGEGSGGVQPWDFLKLPIGAEPRLLDPLEELMQREGIEIAPEDRRPKSP
jgi:hypothetical protein